MIRHKEKHFGWNPFSAEGAVMVQLSNWTFSLLWPVGVHLNPSNFNTSTSEHFNTTHSGGIRMDLPALP